MLYCSRFRKIRRSPRGKGLSTLECFAECLISICLFIHFFFPGDLTEDQKKIFKANQFYRGLTIPEPQEMVSQIHVRLLLILFQKNPLEFFLGKTVSIVQGTTDVQVDICRQKR